MKTPYLIPIFALLSAIAIVACNGDDGSDGTPTPSPIFSTAATPSATPSIENEVGAAYLDYWDAYSAALLELDVSLAGESASGKELDRIAVEIAGLQAQGLALRVRVEHNFAVIDPSDNTASVVDDIVNNSFFVDAETKEPPEAEGSGERIQDTFNLEKINGRWVVVSSTRLQVGG
jgi:hypothetical protein